MSKAAICILVVAVPGLSCAAAWQQVQKPSEYQVWAVFLYRFAIQSVDSGQMRTEMTRGHHGLTGTLQPAEPILCIVKNTIE